MADLTLYRKRLIPFENVKLTNDIILYADDKRIVTRWNCLSPREDMDHGYSLYILEDGVKISKFCKKDGSLCRWYCDIVEYTFESDTNTLTSLDLLLDITISPEGFVRVLDMDELADAHENGLIDDALLHLSLIRCNTLLCRINSGKFSEYTDYIDSFIR